MKKGDGSVKQEGKKLVKLIAVLVAILVVVLLAISLAFNSDALFGGNKGSGDKNINIDSDVNKEVVDKDANVINDNVNNENNKKENSSGDTYIELPGTKKIGDIEISNIRIELIEKDRCRFTASVKNMTDKFLTPTNVSIKVINEKGETENVFGGIITELIREEENTFTTYILADITDAYDVEFEIIDM